VIQVLNLSKDFLQKNGEQLKAVDDLSFTAEDGQIVCLLGVNGAGKTTTMRLLSTIFKPTSGAAYINGYSVTEQAQQVRENLGFLTGDTGLYNRLTGREFVTYFGRLYGMQDTLIDKRMSEMGEVLEIKDFIDKKIDSLSTGMKQKISILRSIIHDPPVMILDEPTAGLDVLTARNIVAFIRDCKTRGKCVLFSTHIMREAERLADKIVMVHKGKLLKEGKLDDLRTDTNQQDLDEIFVAYINQETEMEVKPHEF